MEVGGVKIGGGDGEEEGEGGFEGAEDTLAVVRWEGGNADAEGEALEELMEDDGGYERRWEEDRVGGGELPR